MLAGSSVTTATELHLSFGKQIWIYNEGQYNLAIRNLRC
ncbi:MAG: hypothetical protein FD122_991 [Stygiobacter sp.]|nr:MAG: hypothetical protein FD122_991 [Stygiobacter sp.]KAF0217800.1 MAG: hypothetical protein FD178_334 [Ignavibacteria bacterium]